jgi:hypothetical protein
MTRLGMTLGKRRSRTLRHEVGRIEVDGGIAQLVEHYAGSVRVRSSSLLASTKERSLLRAFFFVIGGLVCEDRRL